MNANVKYFKNRSQGPDLIGKPQSHCTHIIICHAHTYIHTYIYIHTYTYKDTYKPMPTYIHTYLHTDSCVFVYIIYKHSYMPLCMPGYIHEYLYSDSCKPGTDTQTGRYTFELICLQTSQYTWISSFLDFTDFSICGVIYCNASFSHWVGPHYAVSPLQSVPWPCPFHT